MSHCTWNDASVDLVEKQTEGHWLHLGVQLQAGSWFGQENKAGWSALPGPQELTGSGDVNPELSTSPGTGRRLLWSLSPLAGIGGSGRVGFSGVKREAARAPCVPQPVLWGATSRLPHSPPSAMLCLCLTVLLPGETPTEFQYFESRGLPSELKSIFRLSVLIPSQEFSTFRRWKQVCALGPSREECQKCGSAPLPHGHVALVS